MLPMLHGSFETQSADRADIQSIDYNVSANINT